jgi:hypothetical protein
LRRCWYRKHIYTIEILYGWKYNISHRNSKNAGATVSAYLLEWNNMESIVIWRLDTLFI